VVFLTARRRGGNGRELLAIAIILATVAAGLNPNGTLPGGFHERGVGSSASFPALSRPGVVSADSSVAPPRVISNVSVGDTPVGVAYDSGRGEVFVANEGSANVSVIADANNTVVATVTVGTDPWGVAYDRGKGEVFVGHFHSDNVSVICDGSAACGGPSGQNKVVVTVTVGSNPEGLAYDSEKGEVFVTNEGSANVSVIADSNNTVVATVVVGADPFAADYSAETGQVFVVNDYSDNVSMICDGSTSCGGPPDQNKVVASTVVGINPAGVAYDRGKGEVFVTNLASNNVSVINEHSNTVVATISVGTSPRYVAYDSANGELFVTNALSNNASVISDSNNTVVATVPMGVWPEGVAYDSGQGEVFITNENSGTVSIIAVPSVTSSSSSSSGLPPLDYAIVGGVAVVVAIGVAAGLLRRRGKAPPKPMTIPTQPGPGAPPT